jgi:hypothetical protein
MCFLINNEYLYLAETARPSLSRNPQIIEVLIVHQTQILHGERGRERGRQDERQRQRGVRGVGGGERVNLFVSEMEQ